MRLKRQSMPGFWKLPRKQEVWVSRPVPGPHGIGTSLPLQLVLRDVLGYAETAQEAKKILKQGKILIDKKARKEPRFPVGLMDLIEIPEMKKAFRVDITEKGFALRPAGPDEADKKLCRIIGKRSVRGGTIQLNLHDGRSILVKDVKAYSPLDSVLISLPGQQILKHFKFAPGADAVIIAGKNAGISGKIKEIKRRKSMLEQSSVTLQVKNKTIQTLMDYVMVGDVKAPAPAKTEKKVKK